MITSWWERFGFNMFKFIENQNKWWSTFFSLASPILFKKLFKLLKKLCGYWILYLTKKSRMIYPEETYFSKKIKVEVGKNAQVTGVEGEDLMRQLLSAWL